ncbi:hypothetical protein T01_15122 [Trichinella spiralis]|uniref:Uncharacterized protein n=1 Tax=Trichinella spiralis TaxID=6334 RepID=A0A0V1BFJ4_TRISP|nr:hypothetical protein T01_15122 [Trichinella spiralis]
MFTDSNAIALQGETMGMHKVRIVSLSPKAMPQAIFEKHFPSGYASGKLYANICPQAMLRAMPPAKFPQIICKYLPSGYAWGYASGRISSATPLGSPKATIQDTPQAEPSSNF